MDRAKGAWGCTGGYSIRGVPGGFCIAVVSVHGLRGRGEGGAKGLDHVPRLRLRLR